MAGMNYVADVVKFHEKFGVPIRDSAGLPSYERKALRFTLIVEEITELTEAFADDDLEKIADGIADAVYVLIGAALEYGIPFAAVWKEVHAANMRKVNGPVRADGKILKPEGWRGPDIERVLRVGG